MRKVEMENRDEIAEDILAEEMELDVNADM